MTINQHELDRYARDLDANFITREEILAQVAPLWMKLGFEDNDVRAFHVEPDSVTVTTLVRDADGKPMIATAYNQTDLVEMTHTYRTVSLEEAVELAQVRMELDELAETSDSVTKVE
jgi:hypothetical protein